MKRRTIITVALLGAALTVGLILYLCARLDNSRVTVTSTGPLDIRLWGIRPDAGDTIFDPNGNKIAETVGNARRDRAVWEDNHQRCDFIFEIPDTNEPVTFLHFFRCFVNGEEKLGGRFVKSSLYFEHNGRNFGWFQTVIPRTTRRSLLFGAWKRDVPVDRIDLNLRYYCGPRQKPICVFKGPFEAGRKVTDETGLYEISFVPHPFNSPAELIMQLHPRPKNFKSVHALFYDREGKRHLAGIGSGWTGTVPPGGMGFAPPRTSLKNIATITIGEKPFEMTVKNLSLSASNSEHRTYARHLDKIAQRLDPGRDPTRYVSPSFRDLDAAVKVIDVVRGEQISRICRILCSRSNGKPRFDPATLDAEQLQRFKQAALRWADAMDPAVRIEAARLSLHCGWPEFYDLALDLLQYPDRNYFRGADPVRFAAVTLCSQREHIPERHVERIAELQSRQTRPASFDGYLLDCLHYPKSAARVKVLWDWANCEQPRLWAYAVGRLSMWGEFDGKHDSLPEKLKPRVFLIRGRNGFSDPNQIASEASALLLSLLSGRLLTNDTNTYMRLIDRVPESIDRRAVTAVMIESLRNMEYRRDWSIWSPISRIVKYLNLWHGLDIGGFGTNLRKQTPDLDKIDFEAIAAEAVEWYDAVYCNADPNALR